MGLLTLREDGIIEHILKGDQTKESIKQGAEEIKGFIAQLRSQNKKVLVLIDMSSVNLFDEFVKEESMKGLTQLDYDKVALIGANVVIKQLATMLIHSIGQSHRVDFFSTQKEALAWLKS